MKAEKARKPPFEKAGQFITELSATHILKQNSQSKEYGFEHIAGIESIDKIDFPVYEITSYKDGHYNSSSSFRNIIPAGSVSAEFRNEKTDIVKRTGKKRQAHESFIRLMYM